MHLEMDPEALDAIEAEILKRQQTAIEGFQEELRNLKMIRQLVARTQVEAPIIDAAAYKKLKNGRPNGHAKPNGHHQPYAKLTMGQSIVEILTQKPGLMATEVTPRLVDGGFPFKTKKPLASVGQTLNDLVKAEKLRSEKPESRVGGQANRYYLP
jgi:hypothetical protein